MLSLQRPSSVVCRALAVTAVLGAGVALAGAQSAQTDTGTNTAAVAAKPTLNLYVPASDLSAQNNYSTSSLSSADVATITPGPLTSFNAMQYNGGRYGRPRYRGGNKTADGTNKYEFYAGGGFTLPTGPTHQKNSTSWGVQAGVGRNFNKHLGMNVEFDWDNFGLQGSNLAAQQNLYNGYIEQYNATLPGGDGDPNAISDLAGLDGYSHDWSFSLQPVYNVTSREGINMYLTGGVGFYHKITTFTIPSVGEYCDYIYGCYEYEANQPIDSYTSNAPGVDGGVGFTYKFSRFSGERFYAEARYVYTFNQSRPGVDATTCTTADCLAATASLTNDYPANSRRTSYVPVKFGIRF